MNTDRIPDLPSDLKPLEADLAALAPTTGALNRDELMYRAGWEARAAARVPLAPPVRTFRAAPWLWPLTTAGLLLVSLTLGAILATRTDPEPRIVYVERQAIAKNEQTEPRSTTAQNTAAQNTPAPNATAPNIAAHDSASVLPIAVTRRPGSGDHYLALRERMLAFGVEVLSTTTPSPPSSSETRTDSRYGAMIGDLLGG
jgi:hypothetical protein